MSETEPNPHVPRNSLPTSLYEIGQELSMLVDTHTDTEATGTHGVETEYSSWHGDFKKLELGDELEQIVGLGNVVDAHVVGDAQTGVAIIMKARHNKSTKGYGFFVQPNYSGEPNLPAYDIWHGPADLPRKDKVYFGKELINDEVAQKATPEVSSALVAVLVDRADSQRSKRTLISGLRQAINTKKSGQ